MLRFIRRRIDFDAGFTIPVAEIKGGVDPHRPVLVFKQVQQLGDGFV